MQGGRHSVGDERRRATVCAVRRIYTMAMAAALYFRAPGHNEGRLFVPQVCGAEAMGKPGLLILKMI